MPEPAVTRAVVIRNPQGLHARPAEVLARRALNFQSQIEVIKDDLRVDAKSILHILTLGANQGTHLVLEARGVDAEQAVEALVALIENHFNEEPFTEEHFTQEHFAKDHSAEGEPKTDC